MNVWNSMMIEMAKAEGLGTKFNEAVNAVVEGKTSYGGLFYRLAKGHPKVAGWLIKNDIHAYRFPGGMVRFGAADTICNAVINSTDPWPRSPKIRGGVIYWDP